MALLRFIMPDCLQVKPPSQLLADVVGSCVAAVAMGWAILSVYIGQRLIGVNLSTGPNQVPVPPIKVRESAWLPSALASGSQMNPHVCSYTHLCFCFVSSWGMLSRTG